MPKNIVVCSDGTGNSANKGRGTNVFKMYEAIDVSGHRTSRGLKEQVALYDDGVGTQKLKILRLLVGAVGFGLARNVRQLYAEICRIYRPGDHLYLFGFSRGAFTVRALAGLVCSCGVLDVRNLEDRKVRSAVSDCYREYRKRSPAWLERLTNLVTTPTRNLWRRLTGTVTQVASHDGSRKVHFIGVWDTVDSVGFPIWGVATSWNLLVHRYKFSNAALPKGVRRASHALALDEERGPFSPLLWKEPPAPATGAQRVEQVWFPGVHSDIGGGYPKQGLSMITLQWMMERARAAAPRQEDQLRFREPVREFYGSAANAGGQIHDSRSGLGVYYRYRPRNVGDLTDQPLRPSMLERIPGLPSKTEGWPGRSRTPRVHYSAIARIRSRIGGYAPGSLPSQFEVVDAPVSGSWVIQLPTTSTASPFAAARRWRNWRRRVQELFYAAQILIVLSAFALTWKPVERGEPDGLVARIVHLTDGISEQTLGRLQPLAQEVLGDPPNPSSKGTVEGAGGAAESWLYGVAENLVAPVPGTWVQDRVLQPFFGHPVLGIAFVALFPVFYFLGLLGRLRMESIHSNVWLDAARSGALDVPRPVDLAGAEPPA